MTVSVFSSSSETELCIYVPEWVREKIEQRKILECKAQRICDDGLPECVVSIWSEIDCIDRELALFLSDRVSRVGATHV